MATKQPPPIRYSFTADSKKFSQGAQQVEGDLKAIDRQAKNTDQSLDLSVDVDDSALATLRRRLIDARVALENNIRTDVEIDPSEALRNLRRIEGQLRALDRMDVHPEVKVDVDRGFGNVMGTLKGHMSSLSTSMTDLSKSLPVVGTALGALGPYGLAAAAGVAAVGAALAGPGLIGAGTAAPVLLGAKSLLEAYDEIDKGNRKAKIVFGRNLKEVQKWARGLSTNVGLGEKEIVAASSAIQDLLVPQGFKRSEAAAITEEVYERGAALAEFSGVDTAQGVEAVTAALLGSRKQLKGLGVDITASEVKQRIALIKGEDQYKGFTDKMLTTIATTELLREKSGDAWTAFNEGGSEADTILDTFNATMANLKTDAIEGFGGILVDILGDLRNIGDFSAFTEFTSLGDWIKANSDEIRGFFIDLALYTGRAALAALDLGIALVKMIRDTAPGVAAMLKVWGATASAIQLAAGAAMLLNPLTAAMGAKLIESAGGAKNMADAAADAYTGMVNAFGPGVLTGLENVREGVAGVVTDLETLQGLDELTVTLTQLVEMGDTSEVEDQLEYLTEDQLTTFITNIDPKTASKAEKELRALAKERRAEIRATETNAAETDKELDKVAALRLAKIKFIYYDPRTGSYSAGGDRGTSLSAAPQFSRSAATQAVAPTATAGEPTTLVGVAPAGGSVTYSPTINTYYPKPERVSDSIASALRVSRYLTGV